MSKADEHHRPEIDALDWKSHAILRAIAENDGTATTSEISALTGIENNDQILYRFRTKLAPAELVDLTQPESDGSSIRAKIATLTDAGWAALDRLDDDSDTTASLSDQLDQLDARFTQIETRLDALSERLRAPSVRRASTERATLGGRHAGHSRDDGVGTSR